MLKLNKIIVENNGKLINYDYSISADIQKFFEKSQPYYAKYNEDISSIPTSIAVIPFLSNFITIAWFAGFTIEVDEVDEDFYNALQKIKKEFAKRNTSYKLNGKLAVKKLVKNTINGTKSAMLFSGGVDAFATYIRIFNQTPDLVTIHGADIEVNDTEQWQDLVNFNETEPLLINNTKEYIESNLRDFYNYNVDLLLKDLGWWGKVQHGLALVGVLAPLSYINNYKNIYIASSYTDHIDIDWGSTPEVDEKISWAGIQVIHDGYELKRQDKVDLISEFTQKKEQNLRVRVCYSELKTEFNCSDCEKCFRTILGIILSGKDPNDFGFNVNKEVYPAIFERLDTVSLSKGSQYFWWELMEKAKSTDNYFILSDKKYELAYIEKIKNGEIDKMFNKNINKASKSNTGKYKFILRNKFPVLYNFYKKIRY